MHLINLNILAEMTTHQNDGEREAFLFRKPFVIGYYRK